jgi:tetratricopeptide (TPR) repeat protein
MYAEAKDMYTQALAINSKDQYSKNQILQINNLVTQQNDKQKQDSLNNIKYTAAILKADQYFNDKDFANAKTSYSTALKYKADDEYVKERLSEIDAAVQETAVRSQAIKDSLAKDNEDTKKYNALIVKARAAYSKNDFVMARGFYVSANALKPNETEPVNKISAIDDTLNVVAAQKQMRGMSDSLITIAEIALADSDYAVSVERFNDALKLNPADPDYINKQIIYAKYQLKRQEDLNNQTKKTEEQQKKLDDAINLYTQGKAAVNTRNYDSALIYLQQFLNVTDTLGFTSDEYDLSSLIKYSKSKVSDIKSYLERQKNLPKDTAIHKLPDVSTLPGKTIITYYNPKDPKLEPIYKKYPDIDFTRAPDEQRFDSISDYSIENKLISKNVMTAASIDISENSNSGIKLICQNIVFIGQKVYIKLMLQNAAAPEFLTGNMQLIQKLQDGSSIKLLPNYIAGYPIILTNQQKIIVYVTKAKEISDNDSLDFEVADRLNQIKISVTIPGSIYNQEKKKSSK